MAWDTNWTCSGRHGEALTIYDLSLSLVTPAATKQLILQKHDNRTDKIWQSRIVQFMKTKLCLGILLVAAAILHAQTNSLTALLQQGLFEEQANRNLDAAIADYQTLATQFDKDRQLAATAVFRLGECYRAQGKTNEAAVQYQRVLRDFSDQQTLATLSRQDLTGMGFESSPAASAGFAQSRTASLEEQAEIQRIQTMIQNSPDLINAPDGDGHTPLEKAAIHGWLKVAAFLLDHGAEVNARGGAAVFDATDAGNRAMVEFLLSRGANVNAKGNGGFTALQQAARHGFQAVAEVLLANHADVNVQDSGGATALCSAASSGQLKIVQMLLAAGANPNLKDGNGRTVLNFAVKTSPEIFQALLAAGTNPNTENADGRTPLSYAVERDGPQVVKMLLAAKADPNGGKLDAPLLCAIHQQDTVSAKMLLEAGANPNAKGEVDWQPSWNWHVVPLPPPVMSPWHGSATPLWLAVATKQLPMVQLLLKFKADPNDTQIGNEFLLFDALGNTNMLGALLDGGAKPDALDNIVNQRATPLEYAARAGNAAAVEILLRHGADPNFRDLDGDTPLHYAASNDAPSRQVFELLLSHDANPNVRNHDDKTPLDLIKDKEQPFQPDFGRPMRLGSAPPPGAYPRPADAAEPAALAGQLAALLRQHGALDVLPDWDRITVSRPANHFSATVFQRGTNDWNHFTLLELLYQIDYFGNYYKQRISFPDLTRVLIVRPTGNGAKSQRITVNLLNGTNGVDCARDVRLKFGDVVEIPEREHSLAETGCFLSGDQAMTILNHFRSRAGTAKLIVAGGQTVELPLQPFFSQIGQVLSRDNARAALTSNSDLSRVKVTRRDPETGKTDEWTLDCSNQNNQGVPDLWLRAGDVIEVPMKP